MTDKDKERKSKISKCYKGGFKRSSIRTPIDMKNSIGNTNVEGKGTIYESCNGSDFDGNESFKSFAMDGGARSVMSSAIDESQFLDAVDNTDTWYLNPQAQHFSMIPVLTLKSFKSIGKTLNHEDNAKEMFESITSIEELQKSLMANSDKANRDSFPLDFQLSHHLMDQELIKENVNSDSESDSEMG